MYEKKVNLLWSWKTIKKILYVEVNTPEEYMWDIIWDLNSRRWKINKMTARWLAKIVYTIVPLSEMFWYSTKLRWLSQWRATYTMEFFKYEEVSKNITEKIRTERGITFEEEVE